MNYLNKKTNGGEYYSMYVVRLKRRKGVMGHTKEGLRLGKERLSTV